MGYEHREYIGTILPPFDAERRRPSKNGWYLDFTIEANGGKAIPCRIFQEVYEAASDLFEAGRKVALFGYLAGEQLRVKVARNPEKPAVAKHMAFNGTNKEEARKEFLARKKDMAKKGFVPVEEKGGIAWYPLAYTVEVDNKHKLKIEYAIEKLGAPYVAHKLRAEKFVELAKGRAKVMRGFETFYLELLEKLVAEANAINEAEF